MLEEFVDTSKSILDISFKYVEGFDFKACANALFMKQLETIRQIDTKIQYSPL